MHQVILEDDGYPHLFDKLKEIRFDLGHVDDGHYEGIKMRAERPGHDLGATSQPELPGYEVTVEAADGDGHKPHEKEEDAVPREGPEVTEGSEGREAEPSTSKSKATVPPEAGPAQLRIVKPGGAQSALHQKITDNANARAKKMSIFAVGRLQKQFTRSMRQIETSMGTKAPAEQTGDAGNDTITSCSDLDSDMPSPSDPSTKRTQAKDAHAQERQPESSAVRAQSHGGQ